MSAHFYVCMHASTLYIVLLMMTASAEGWICKRTALEVNYGFGERLCMHACAITYTETWLSITNAMIFNSSRSAMEDAALQHRY